MRSLGYGVVVLSTFLWGTTFAAIKLLLDELTPFPVLVLRFAIGLIAYAIILAILHRGLPAFPRWVRRRLLFVALAGSALNSLGVFFAVNFLGAGISSLVIMLVPVLTGLLAFLAGQERLTARKIQGFLVALAGLIIVVLWGGPAAPFADAKVIGLFLMILAALGFAIYNVFSKPLFAHYSPVEVTAYVGILASLSVVPFLWYTPFRDDLSAIAHLSVEGWLIVLYIAVGSNVGASLGWYWALRRLEATRVALFSYLIPVWGLTSAALLLRELVTWWLPVGVALVVAGIVLANRRPAAQAETGPAETGPPRIADASTPGVDAHLTGGSDDVGALSDLSDPSNRSDLSDSGDADDVGMFGSPDWLVLAGAVEERSAESLAAWSRRTADGELAEVLELAAARARDRAYRLRRAVRDRGEEALSRQTAGRECPHPNPLPEGEGTGEAHGGRLGTGAGYYRGGAGTREAAAGQEPTVEASYRGAERVLEAHAGSEEAPEAHLGGEGALEVQAGGGRTGADLAPVTTTLDALQRLIERPGLYDGLPERQAPHPDLADLLRRLRESERATRRLLEEQCSRLVGEQHRRSIRRLAGTPVQPIGAGGSAGRVIWRDGVGGPALVQIAQAPETSLHLGSASQARWVALLHGQGVCRLLGDGAAGAPLQLGRLVEIAAGAEAEFQATGEWPLAYLIIGPVEALPPNT